MAAVNPGTFQHREPDGDPFPGATADSSTVPLSSKFQHRRSDNGDLPVAVTLQTVALGAVTGQTAILGVLWKGPWT